MFIQFFIQVRQNPLYLRINVSYVNYRILSLFCHGLDCEAIILFFMNKWSVPIAGIYIPSSLSPGENGLIEISRNGKTKLVVGDYEESIELIFYIEPFGSDTYRLNTGKDLEITYAAPIDASEFDYVIDSAGEDLEQYGLTVDYENGMGILSGSLTS